MLCFKYSISVLNQRVLWPRQLEKNLDETKLPRFLACRTYQHLYCG